MYSRQAYRFEKPILYNNVNTESLYGAVIEPENVAYIAPLGRCIRAGSFLATGDRLLPRARIISPYTSDSNNVIVSNPAVFKPGDVLKLIGTSSSTPQQEAAAVFQGSAVSFGTVVSVDASLVHQVVTCTVGNVSPGNIFILLIEGVSFSCTATTFNPADVVSALKSVFDAAWGQTLGFAEIRTSASGDTLTFVHILAGEVFEVKGNVLMGTASTVGSLDIEVQTPVGVVTITPAAGNGNQSIGAKIGTITDVPLGVIANEYLLTDDDGVDYARSIAAYNKAPIFTKSLPYLDGAIVQQLPGLSFMPVYGG